MLRKIQKKKKGVSIMIGYILLISMAAAISVFVYGWVKTYVPKDISECPDGTSLSIKEISCLNPGGNYTKLLLHINTDFTDSSPSNHVVTANGNVQVNTLVKKFGIGSAKFDGNGNDYLSIPDSPDFNFLDKDFTIDFWYKDNGTIDNNFRIITKTELPARAPFLIFFLGTANPNKILFLATPEGGTTWGINIDMGDISSTEFIHYAIVREGDTFTTYRNGVQQDTLIESRPLIQNTEPLIIGGNWTTSPDIIKGYLDEVHISKGIAKWTSNFSVPSNEYTISNSNYILDLNLKNNGRFNLAGYFIHATNDSNQELATIDLSSKISEGGIIFGSSILFAEGGSNLMAPNEEKGVIFNLDSQIYLLEIIPIRFQEEGTKTKLVSCGESKTKETVNCN